MPTDDEQLDSLLSDIGALYPSADAAQRAIARARASLSRDSGELPKQKWSHTMATKFSIAAALVLAIAASAFGIYWASQPPKAISQPSQQEPEQREPEEHAQDKSPNREVVQDDTPNEPLEPNEPEETTDSVEVAVDDPDDQSIPDEPDEPDSIDPDWGHLTGTFKFSGEYTATPITITSDRAFCGKHPIVDESVVVDPETRGLKNVILYLYLSRGDEPPKAHPSYAAAKEKPVVLDNVHCRFEPHITLLRTGQTLQVRNSDSVGHNSRIDSRAKPMSPLIPPSGEHDVVFDEPERLPVKVSCNIHPWMQGYVVIKDNPYMAVTDNEGNFRIENLPVGKWTFQVWHEQIGYVRDVTVDGKEVEWSRGRIEIEIHPGVNDIGKVEIESVD